MVSSSISKAHVWLIDDDREFCEVLKELLEPAFDMDVFHAADDLLKRVSDRGHPDAMVVDIRMPGVSGLDLVRSLGDSRPPIVFVTGEASDDVQAVAAELAVFDVIEKPFDHQALEAVLQRAILNHHSARQGDQRDDEVAALLSLAEELLDTYFRKDSRPRTFWERKQYLQSQGRCEAFEQDHAHLRRRMSELLKRRNSLG